MCIFHKKLFILCWCKIKTFYVCWFLAKNLSTFVSFLWRHYNPYCHNVQPFWHAYCSHRSCLLGTIQDFLFELDINFSLYHVIVRPTKIINHLGIPTLDSIYVLVGLTMTWYSEKNDDSYILSFILSFMPNSHKKSWMVSIVYVPLYSVTLSIFHPDSCHSQHFTRESTQFWHKWNDKFWPKK